MVRHDRFPSSASVLVQVAVKVIRRPASFPRADLFVSGAKLSNNVSKS